MAKEPGVSASIIDKSQTITTNNVDSSIKTLVCVYSDSGTQDLSYVNNVTSFLNEYTANGKIEPGTHPTVVYAYTLLQSTPLYIKRVGKQYIFPAITSLGESVLVDKENNLVSGNKLNITASNQNINNYWFQTDTHLYYAGNKNGLPSGKTNVQVSQNANIQELFGNMSIYAPVDVYESSQTSFVYSKSIVSFSDNIAYLKKSVNTGKYKVISATTASNMSQNDYLFFGGYDFYFATATVGAPANSTNPVPIGNPDYSSDMPAILFLQRVLEFDSYINSQLNVKYNTDAAQNIEISELKGISLGVDKKSLVMNSNVMEESPYVKIGTHILYCGSTEPVHTNETLVQLSKSDSILSNNFMILLWDYIKANAIANITLDAASYVNIIVYSGISIQQSSTNTFTISYDPNSIVYTYNFPLESENSSLIVYNDLYIQINSILYYIGSLPSNIPSTITKVKVSNQRLSIDDFVLNVNRNLLASFECNSVSDGILFLEPVVTGIIENHLQATISPVSYSSQALFAVAQKFTSDVSKLQFSYTALESEGQFNVSTTYNGSTNEVTISFIKGDVDGFGQTIYYDSERYTNKYYKYIKLNDNGKYLQSFKSNLYGGEIKSAPFDNNDIIEGISDVFKNNSSILWDIVTDSGISDPSIARYISTQSTMEDINRNYQYYVSLPATYTKAKDISLYVQSLNLNNFKCSYLAAAFETVINGITFTMPGSLLALISFYTLSSVNSTIYCPGFGQKYGTVSSNNITQVFGESDRKSLLDDKVNTVKKIDNSAYFINDNLTSQKIKSLMSDTNNVRMVCVINNRVNQVVDQFIGELNTLLVRNRVQEVLSSLLNGDTFRECVFKPESINIICDERNNTSQVLANNQLAIDIEVLFSATIKYVKVYSIILPLNSTTS